MSSYNDEYNDEWVLLYQRINQLEYNIQQEVYNSNNRVAVAIIRCIFGAVVIILVGVYVIVKYNN